MTRVAIRSETSRRSGLLRYSLGMAVSELTTIKPLIVILKIKEQAIKLIFIICSSHLLLVNSKTEFSSGTCHMHLLYVCLYLLLRIEWLQLHFYIHSVEDEIVLQARLTLSLNLIKTWFTWPTTTTTKHAIGHQSPIYFFLLMSSPHPPT